MKGGGGDRESETLPERELFVPFLSHIINSLAFLEAKMKSCD